MRWAAVLTAAAALLAYGWWTTGLRPFTATSAAAVVGAGIGAMAIGLCYERRRQAVARLRWTEVGAWLMLFAALGTWQLAAYLQHPRSQHPTLSSLVNTTLDAHPARALCFAVWFVGAARLARR